MKNVDDLVALLELSTISKTDYSGLSVPVGSPNVFGGQVVAQALNAAYKTIHSKRILHSLHSYFLEAGRLNEPIIYSVNIIRDGGSFSTRRVTAKQNGVTIFILACSFQKKEIGFEHQIPMPKNIPEPENLMSWQDIYNTYNNSIPKHFKAFLELDRPIDFKPTQIENTFKGLNSDPNLNVWFKLRGDVSALNLALKQQILAYISDYNILTTALNPHRQASRKGLMQMASLDHSMWFYRDFSVADWLLFSIVSPNAGAARGFSIGHIFNRAGLLIASATQEGLMRTIKQK